MYFNRYTVAVAFAAVAGLAVLSGPTIFAGCCFVVAGVAAFAICLEL